MDLKQIEKLIIAMENSRIKRIVLKKEDFEIELEKECMFSPSASNISYAVPITQPTPFAPQSAPSQLSTEDQQSQEVKEKPQGSCVNSPMVGTFYVSPSPEDPPFVKIGDQVEEQTVVCIIEAMKVMNEVKAGISGVVSEILLKNGEPVEFGTPILRVMPA